MSDRRHWLELHLRGYARASPDADNDSAVPPSMVGPSMPLGLDRRTSPYKTKATSSSKVALMSADQLLTLRLSVYSTNNDTKDRDKTPP
jgi:hypothetical protein